MDTSKIIKGVVSNGRYTVTAPIVKEDYGLYLKIEGVELPSTYEVDFSNSENNGTSVTMIGNADGVLIPSQFIKSGKDVFAFLYHVGANYGRTVYKFRIPNKVRPDRTNEEPTPEEQSVIDQAISALNTAVSQTAQDVVDADASAQSAQGYAEQAETAKTNAQTYDNNASASATSASQSAQASANSATASAQSASEAQTASTNAETYALNSGNKAVESAQSASASANSASQAQGYAQSASASAQSASGYASNAQTYSQTASAKAQDASQSASTASQKATEATQSATNASQSAQTAEQAKTASQTAQGLAEGARDTAVSAKTDAESARDDAESARDEAQQAVASISGALADKAPVITDTASGSIASFPDGADNLPLKSLIVNIDPVQDLSQGDPSPENICPISGWTQVEVNHSDADMTNPTTITIDLGQTVYGGKLDVLSGVLTVDRAMATFDGSSDENWYYYSVATGNLFRTSLDDRKQGEINLSNPDSKSYKCNAYKVAKGGSSSRINGTVSGAVKGVDFVNNECSTLAEWRQYLSENSIQFVYPLAEPIEIQLAPTEVRSLLGQNNIFADTGDTEVEYRANTELYINKKIAEALASLT